MNVTELARILKITPQELRDNLPQYGFSIGRKAIKVNRNVANKIIREWPAIRRKMELAKQEELRKEEEEKEQKATEAVKVIKIPKIITVRELSNISGIPINKILAELMKNSIFASLNEKIDFETAWLVGSELGLDIRKKEGGEEENKENEDGRLKEVFDREDNKDLLSRPPVIVVMGHVDHGKTKLLDAIRRTNVVDGEAGGITQHIGAYQVTRRNKLITFVDTPGHEAFTAMRSRGARIADIAILVVAADDGVKPQTVEAFRIIEAAKIPYVVAINKIDKPGANIDKTKQELSNQLKITPEDWGGKIICAPISAKQGDGIIELLDMVLLIAETETENIKANPEAPAIGTIIESHIDKGAGPVATILIQNGTLKISDQLALNNIDIGRVRGLNNYKGIKIESAGPATPVQIIGLKNQPGVGDIIEVGKGEKIKSRKRKTIGRAAQTASAERSVENDKEVKKINIIVKSDVLGSGEAIEESLEKINTKKIKIKIIRKGLGNITDGDIKRAEACDGLIVGFNVKVPPTLEEIVREKNVEIKLYNIIYDLINDIKERMQKIVVPTIERQNLGRLKVKAVFKTDKNEQIIGGKITEGRAEAGSMIEVKRAREIVATGKLTKLQSGKQDVGTCEEGQECGIQYEGKPVIAEGDVLQFYKENKIIDKI